MYPGDAREGKKGEEKKREKKKQRLRLAYATRASVNTVHPACSPLPVCFQSAAIAHRVCLADNTRRIRFVGRCSR